MKRYILSIIILFTVFACNESNTPPVTSSLPVADSFPGGIDTSLGKVDSLTAKEEADKAAKPANNLEIGLTEEEMKDDTVFSDGSRPTSWEIAGITDVKGFKLFLKQVQSLVLNNNKEQLAKLIRYPLNKSIKTENDFIKNYDTIFSKEVSLSIAKINFSQIFRNSKGVMSEDGKVWFSQEGKDFKIIAVNS